MKITHALFILATLIHATACDKNASPQDELKKLTLIEANDAQLDAFQKHTLVSTPELDNLILLQTDKKTTTPVDTTPLLKDKPVLTAASSSWPAHTLAAHLDDLTQKGWNTQHLLITAKGTHSALVLNAAPTCPEATLEHWSAAQNTRCDHCQLHEDTPNTDCASLTIYIHPQGTYSASTRTALYTEDNAPCQLPREQPTSPDDIDIALTSTPSTCLKTSSLEEIFTAATSRHNLCPTFTLAPQPESTQDELLSTLSTLAELSPRTIQTLTISALSAPDTCQ